MKWRVYDCYYELLGTVEADTRAQARMEARLRWPEFGDCLIVLSTQPKHPWWKTAMAYLRAALTADNR